MYVEGFASKLKKARANTGFTQREVAKEINIAPSVLARYETGKLEPSIETLGLLVDFYQITADWLLGTGNNQKEEHTLRKKTKSPETNQMNFFVSARDNIIKENGNMYIKLTSDQMNEIKKATE